MKEGKEHIFNTTLDDLSLLTRSPCSFTLGSWTRVAGWADAAEGFCPSLLPESFLSTAKFCPELPSSAFRAFNLAISSSSCENLLRVFCVKQGVCLFNGISLRLWRQYDASLNLKRSCKVVWYRSTSLVDILAKINAGQGDKTFVSWSIARHENSQVRLI